MPVKSATITPVRILALDLVNALLQREIEAAARRNHDLALELAQIKFQINQSFDETRRSEK